MRRIISYILVISIIITMGFFASPADPVYAATAAVSQIDVPYIDSLPNQPVNYKMIDWNQRARDFDSILFDVGSTGDYLPLLKWDTTHHNMESNSFKVPAYVGQKSTLLDGDEEAVAGMSSVLGAALTGIDKSKQSTNGYSNVNFADMCRNFYTSEGIIFNKPHNSQGYLSKDEEFWYTLNVTLQFAYVDYLYPSTSMDNIFQNVADKWYQAIVNMGGSNLNFNYMAYDFTNNVPVGTVRGQTRTEPDSAMGAGLFMYMAYKKFGTQKYLDAANWCQTFIQKITSNPSYELLQFIGPMLAARMNAEQNQNNDVETLMNWAFDTDTFHRPYWGGLKGTYGGYGMDGLIGSSNDNGGNYAFAMNTFSAAMNLVPTARYDQQYARTIGKWMLNLASNARLFYADQMDAAHQESTGWSLDTNNAIPYEGLRYQKLNDSSIQPYATGDPINYGWDFNTDRGIYSGALSGVLGGIVSTTNVDKILKLDLLKTDFFHDTAYPSYLYYNPYTDSKSVEIDVGSTACDIYDAVTDTILASNVTDKNDFSIPADTARVIVLAPANSSKTLSGNNILLNNVFVAYRGMTTQVRNEPIGSIIWLKAGSNGKYASAADETNTPIEAVTSVPGEREQYLVVNSGARTIALKSLQNGKYLSALDTSGHPVYACATGIGSWEKFVWKDCGNGSIALYSPQWNTYVSVDPGTQNAPLRSSCTNSSPSAWEYFKWGGVSLDKKSGSMTAGETVTLTATVSPEDAADKTVTFASGNTGIATVSEGVYDAATGTTSVTVQAISEGDTTITASAGGYTDTYVLHVNAATPGKVEVTGVTLDKESGTLTAGTTDTLTATVSPADATDKTVTFASGNTVVATVTGAVYNAETGKTSVTIQAISAGDTTITATAAGFTDTYTIHVNAPFSNGPGTTTTTSPSSQEPQPVISNGEIKVDVKTSTNGTATVQLKTDDLTKTLDTTTDKSLTITLKPVEGTKAVDVTIPSQFITGMDKNQIDKIKINTGLAIVSINPDMLKEAIGEETKNVQLTVAKVDTSSLPAEVASTLANSTVYDFRLSVGGDRITRFNGNDVAVSLQYTLKPGETPNKVVLYYINDQGKLELIKNGIYNPTTGRLEFKAKYFSKYAVGYKNANFVDLADATWAKDSIEALAARGIVDGVGKNAFNPTGKVTRAEFVSMLINSLDLMDSSATCTFNDVEIGKWYSSAIATAQKLGIVTGETDKIFGVNDNISRQDMAVMLYRAIQVIKAKMVDKTEKIEFSDSTQISTYALNAVGEIQQAGIMNGVGNNLFAPKQNATRAEAAVTIYKLFRLD